MATIRRCLVTWSGLGALPGVSVFYAPSGVDPTGDIADFFDGIKGLVPTGCQWQVPNGGDELDDATGTLLGSWSGAGNATIAATGGTGGYPAGVGAYVKWSTAAVVGGRRLKGRTFICPLWSGAYDSSGTIATATLSNLVTEAVALAASGSLVIWHRPSSGGSGGSSSGVTGADVPDQVTSLRTRRR